MTRYWILVSPELWHRRSTWPPVEGWRLTGETGPPTRAYGNADGLWFPVEAEVEDDDEAATNLAGQLVDVTLQRTHDGVRVMERRLLR